MSLGTEVVRDSLNPQFVKTIEMTNFFEEILDLKAEVYDVDDFQKPGHLQI
jgi:hypothetical protein